MVQTEGIGKMFTIVVGGWPLESKKKKADAIRVAEISAKLLKEKKGLTPSVLVLNKDGVMVHRVGDEPDGPPANYITFR